MPTSAPTVIARSGMSATIQSGGLGLFQLVFRRATVKAELPCRGHQPVGDDPALLLEKAMVELAFFDECDDVLEWADELDLDVANPETLAEFKAVDEARSNLIVLIGQQRYDALQTEIAIGQALSAAAFGYASSQDDQT
ncbi:MAG: hypothetical protein JJ884_06670 [Maricaulis sp.]|uniref:hypothetical protein n=1 Tax=Maricaulis sp. TaxID=1486257 RepID=UPI001B2F42A8|nr:hypothetical protein [Maricaulis sp.]MBO6729736.1 hypothetical protein [Maricaulis sp.]MBO6847187.1 hypothetical protein [Maricaulis sp.]MBO6876845.1 hypothetical protein [Maricaulis sp.]